MRMWLLALGLAVVSACGGAQVGGESAMEATEADECEGERFSEPPWDQGMNPPAETVAPDDTPQPPCGGDE